MTKTKPSKPCASTIYLDKPMRNHTLMQTIARANRVAKDKVNGLIVDYIGVFRNLQKALAIYAAPTAGQSVNVSDAVKSKAALIEWLKQALTEATAFCANASKPINIFTMPMQETGAASTPGAKAVSLNLLPHPPRDCRQSFTQS